MAQKPNDGRRELAQLLTAVGASADEILDALEQATQAAEPEILLRLGKVLSKFDTLKNGRLRPSGENMRRLGQLRRELRNVLLEGRYTLAVREFVSAFERHGRLFSRFFGQQVPDFERNESVLDFALRTAREDTVESLLGSGVDARFVEPVKRMLTNNVRTGAMVDVLEAQLSRAVGGEDGLLRRYVRQVASDSLTQFESNYLQAITSDLGLEWYLYEGTKISTTRPFCQSRRGRYFHREEVRAWAKLNWDGKAAGTNADSIFVYRGGYNCRHLLIPVIATAVPQADKERARQAGFYSGE